MKNLNRMFCLSACLGVCAFAQGTGTPSASGAPSSSPSPAPVVGRISPPVPPKDEIHRVLDYFFHGQYSPPALVEFTPCLNVDAQRGSPTFYQCVETPKETVPLNTRIHLWTMWYLPQGSKYEDILLLVYWGDQLRSTDDYKLETSGRFRTWRTVNLNRKGTWTFKIVSGTQELGSQKLVVE